MAFRSFMDEALEETRAAALRGEVPVGAVVVAPAGEVAARAGNRTRELSDPTAHAEVQAIRAACRAIEHFSLEGATIYSSCEPCPLCLAACLWSRADRVVFAADRYDAAVVREPAYRPLAPARRKAETLRFARRAARRLVSDIDPELTGY